MDKPSHDTVLLRKFLIEKFDDGELMELCFDYFPAVYDDFTDEMRKRKKVQLILDYCRRHTRFSDLMAALSRERPRLFQLRFASSAQRGTPTSIPPAFDEHNPWQVFISHAHLDSEIAQRLAADLRTNEWDVWIAPDSILAGEKWGESIERGLLESGVFVLIITPNAVASRWVKTETTIAIELEHKGLIKFVPLLVQQCQLPLLWGAYQLIDLSDSYENGWKQLLETIGAVNRLEIGQPATNRNPDVWFVRSNGHTFHSNPESAEFVTGEPSEPLANYADSSEASGRFDYHDKCLDEGFTRIGWPNAGDMRRLGEGRLVPAAYSYESLNQNTRRYLDQFASIQVGDVILIPANRKQFDVHLGIVTPPPLEHVLPDQSDQSAYYYHHNIENGAWYECAHRVNVQWIHDSRGSVAVHRISNLGGIWQRSFSKVKKARREVLQLTRQNRTLST